MALERAKGRSERSRRSEQHISAGKWLLMPSMIKRRRDRAFGYLGADARLNRAEVGSAVIVPNSVRLILAEKVIYLEVWRNANSNVWYKEGRRMEIC